MPPIEFRHVSLSFGEEFTLRDVTFTLGQRQTICVTGDCGSGKSVLLRLAMGLLRPSKGKIFIEGRAIEKLEEDELLAIRSASMGLMFQEDALFSGMNAYDNTAYRLVEHRWSARAVMDMTHPEWSTRPAQAGASTRHDICKIAGRS